MNYDKNKIIMPIYNFCEQELSEYEKTIYILAIAYGMSPIYILTDEHIQELSYFLEVNEELLKKALTKWNCQDKCSRKIP